MHQACNQPWYLQKALKIVGRLRGKPKQGPLSFSKIQKILKKRRPICVMVQWGQGAIMHFVVISGCAKSSSGDKWVDIEDPDSGRSTWLYKEFRSNYQYDQGHWIYTFLVKK